jgi:hypothetical protein
MDWAAELRGFSALLAVYFACYAAYAFVPVSQLTPGYVIDPTTKSRQLYRLSGFRCLVVLVTCAVICARFGVLPGDFFYTHYWQCLRASFTLGLLLSLCFFAQGRSLLKRGLIDRRARCATSDAPLGGAISDTAEFDARSVVSHFYCGLSQFNPQGPLGVDFKMYLYLVGAVQVGRVHPLPRPALLLAPIHNASLQLLCSNPHPHRILPFHPFSAAT